MGQLAATQALLIASGLLISTLVYLVQTSPGFDADRVVVAMYYLPEETYTTYEQMVGFHRALIHGVAGLPHVAAVGLLTPPPFGFGESRLDVRVEGRPEPVISGLFSREPQRDRRRWASLSSQAASSTIEIGESDNRGGRRQPIREGVPGRRRSDRPTSASSRDRPTGCRSSGSCRHMATRSIGDAGRPQVYQPLLATATHFTAIMVRTTNTDPMVVMPEIRAVAQRLDPDLPLFERIVDGES